MGWCPNCKNEYVAGIKMCPKCDIDLLDSKDEALRGVVSEDSHNESPLNLYLKSYKEKDLDDTAFLEALAKDSKNDDLGKEYFEKVLAAADDTEGDIIMERNDTYKKNLNDTKHGKSSTVYEAGKDKASEMKSSAEALFIVGILGIVFVVLVFMDVIKINFTLSGKIIACSTLGILFLFLIVMGFLSAKSFKILQKSAKDEDNLSAEIQKWYKQNLTKEKIDEGLFSKDDNTAEELKYFNRIKKINLLVSEKFMNLDGAYQDHICEEIYQWVFENED